MSNYLIYNEQTLSSTDDDHKIAEYYDNGWIFGRKHHGYMYQTRSVRVHTGSPEFSLNSENRRILRKSQQLELTFDQVPFPDYSWEIHKLGVGFYTNKFGAGTMSARKIKQMFLDTEANNFNGVLSYSIGSDTIGYCIVYRDDSIMHYCYPFYDLNIENIPVGIAMMTMALDWAHHQGTKHVYLGTAASPAARYKLQFKQMQWWNQDLSQWSSDIKQLKEIIKT